MSGMKEVIRGRHRKKMHVRGLFSTIRDHWAWNSRSSSRSRQPTAEEGCRSVLSLTSAASANARTTRSAIRVSVVTISQGNYSFIPAPACKGVRLTQIFTKKEKGRANENEKGTNTRRVEVDP